MVWAILISISEEMVFAYNPYIFFFFNFFNPYILKGAYEKKIPFHLLSLN